MGRLWAFACREVQRRLRALGFEFDRHAKGSHEIWWNPENRRRTTIPCHPGNMAEGTLRAVLRQAGVDSQDFLQAWLHRAALIDATVHTTHEARMPVCVVDVAGRSNSRGRPGRLLFEPNKTAIL